MAKSFVKAKNMLQFHLLSIGESRLDPKKWNYKDLKARFWRLYLHDESGAAIMIGKQRIPLNPDQVYLIPPNVHFSAHTDKVLTQLNINFQIPPFSGLVDADFYRIGVTPEIRRLILLCRQYFEEKDIEILRLTGVALVTCCLTELPREMLRKKETADSRIAELCSTLEGLYHEKNDTARMMQITGMGSKSTLMRNFRKTTGTTPHQFQLKRKYAYAAELLKMTDLTIGEICETVGIGNQYQFSKYFKKLYGLPPSRYRTDAGKPRG